MVMTDQIKLSLISGVVSIVGVIGTVLIAYFARKFGKQIGEIHKNTNSLVSALVDIAEKKGDKAGYDRAQQEHKDSEKV